MPQNPATLTASILKPAPKSSDVLAERNSTRSTVRIVGVAKNTIVNLLLEVAEVREFQDKTLRNLSSKRIQMDEIWSFVGSKKKNTSPENAQGSGDTWTWTAIDADSTLSCGG